MTSSRHTMTRRLPLLLLLLPAVRVASVDIGNAKYVARSYTASWARSRVWRHGWRLVAHVDKRGLSHWRQTQALDAGIRPLSLSCGHVFDRAQTPSPSWPHTSVITNNEAFLKGKYVELGMHS